MKSSPASKKAIQRLIELSGKGNVTLLCYEKEGQNCHRDIVKSIMERTMRQRHKILGEHSIESDPRCSKKKLRLSNV